jgi:uncharacterized protein
MEPVTHEAERANLQIRAGRASSVIVQRVAPKCAEVFLEWQRGITAASAEFPHYQSTEIHPPQGEHDEWVVIMHFDDQQSLKNWIASPERAEWIDKLPCEIQDFRLQVLPEGFGGWFAGLGDAGQPLPHWKMFITVLFALYPTVMLLTIFLSPFTARFGPAVAILIGNAVSVAFLEWLGMPVISRWLGPWLHANRSDQRTLSLVGLSLLLAALALMTYLFYLVM